MRWYGRKTPAPAVVILALTMVAALAPGLGAEPENKEAKRVSEEREMDWAAFGLKELEAAWEKAGRPYHEFLRVADMSAGLYVLPAGGTDRQRPHAKDEAYYVISGRGRFTVAGEDMAVEPGQVLYVRKGVDHRFHSIREELKLLVIFAPAE